MKVFAVGTKVELITEGEPTFSFSRILIPVITAGIDYEVTWWNTNIRNTDWIQSFEFMPKQGEDCKIGFIK